MKRTLTIITFTVAIGLAGAFALAMAQSSARQPDHPRQQEQSDQSSMPPCPMMKGMMHTMPMGNMMRHMDTMDCPMMKGHSLMAGQCMQMMLSDEDHRKAMIEMFRRNPELREQLRQMLVDYVPGVLAAIRILKHSMQYGFPEGSESANHANERE